MLSLTLTPCWAVHISDGVLQPSWQYCGIAVAALLAALASIRIRDEEIPRVALLTAAFFVASLIHLRLGPTSAHLLLNGLVGVVLGMRAALAIPVGLTLQALLIGHGGILTIGINSCILTLPALLAGWLFALLHRVSWSRHPWFRAALVGGSTLVWTLALVFGAVVVFTNRLSLAHLPNLEPALQTLAHPLVPALACLLAIGAAWAERRLEQPPEFALGLLIGAGSVLATMVLNGLVLLLGGVEDWRGIVTLVFLAHLPLAVLEGVVLGFTVAFLARVKPEMLISWQPARQPWLAKAPTLLLAVAALLTTATPVWAHRLEAEYRVLPDRRIQIESWFETGDSPQNATVKVFNAEGALLLEGKLDGKGLFVFPLEKVQDLRVEVYAGAGHQAELKMSQKELESRLAGQTPFADRSKGVNSRDVLAGISLLLAAGAFLLGLRNARRLRQLERRKSEIE
jgi:cobalt/nickel transport system permease protein